MIVEERIYTLLPGQVPKYLSLYEAEGLPVQLPILEHLLGYFSVDVGPLNTIVHLWAYRDATDLDARRARLKADPAWAAYWRQVQPLISHQQSRLLRPAPFFEARLALMLAAGAAGRHP